MKITVVGVLVLSYAVFGRAQCPVSTDATCSTADAQTSPAKTTAKVPTKGAQKPVKPASGQPATKPGSAPSSAKPASASAEETITKVQADAILVELKEIHTLLQKQQPAAARIDFKKMDFESFPVVKLASDDRWDNVMGKDDAPVTVVEFSDYQCSHCAKFHSEAFAALKAKYIDTGKLRFVSRDYPLWFHPWAMVAAEAARCAGDQNKYWEMRDGLMRHSEELSPAVIEQVARALPLNQALYHACTESRKYYSAIKADQEAALAAQIPATPGFVIGKSTDDALEGKRVMGARSLADFEKLIDEALAAK
jgi:protein-disulfide isomerase